MAERPPEDPAPSRGLIKKRYIMWPLLLALTSLMPVSFSSTNATWDLPTPTNVRIDSYNMKHILKWDPVQMPGERTPVMYRVEGEMVFHSRLMCENITETQCDFTDKVKPFWSATYKVRAELGDRRSAWGFASESPFQANRDTRIGPVRSLVLKPHGNSMTVDFSPPFTPISNIFRFKYRLYYWKKDTEDKEEVPLVLTHHVLHNLEELTVYCVQLKASTDRIEGQMSDPKCERTASREHTVNELAAILTCVIFAFGICATVGYIIYRNHALLKRFLSPPFRIPYHIQEFIDNPPEQPLEMVDCHHTEEDYDRISVVELTLIPEADQMCADPNPVPAEKT